MLKLLELFGGIGAPRCALRNIGIAVKSIDYVEIDANAVRSYNAMFSNDLHYTAQDVRNWNLKPDILVHGSPCQSISIAGKQEGANEGTETTSSLMWETIKIIANMGTWKPQYVIWENVKNLLSKHMIANFRRYLLEMTKLGYVNSYAVLDARNFGIPQARQRIFTISTLNHHAFNFTHLEHKPMNNIANYLLPNNYVDSAYNVTQPSILHCIGFKGIRRATIIKDFAYTITTRQDRTPAQIIDCGNDRYRFLTELECWRLQGYNDNDYQLAAEVCPRKGRWRTSLYRQAGNSIVIPVLESIFKEILRNW